MKKAEKIKALKDQPLLSPEDLKALIDNVDSDEIFIYPQAAELLQVSIQTIEHRVKTKQVPFSGSGARLDSPKTRSYFISTSKWPRTLIARRGSPDPLFFWRQA